MTSLDRVPVGWAARVNRVCGDDPATLRLLEMGLTPGLTLRVVGAAPLGDPIELELRGYRLSVRRREAAQVEVEVLETARLALAGV
jgi:ferrous iron transport protein A